MASSSPHIDLSRYDNSDYDPGPSWLRALWYVVSIFVFEIEIPWPSSMKSVILRFFGGQVGNGVVLKPRLHIKYPWFLHIGDHAWIGEKVWIDNVAPVTISENACLSQGVCVFSGNHDRNSVSFDLRLEPVTIENGAWLAAKSIGCPGTHVGSHAMLTAGAVAKGTLDAFGIYEGNPALRVGTREICD